MDAFNQLRAHLARFDARRRQTELLLWLPRALLAALALALAIALLSRARPLLLASELVWLAAGLALAAAALTAGVVFALRRSLLTQARFADSRFGLRERATTAVEIRAGRLAAPDELAARQLADAVAVTGSVDARRDLPLSFRRTAWLPAAALAVALIALLLLPNPQETVLRQQRATAAAVAEQAATLEAMAESIAADQTLSPEQQAALLQPLEAALATLREPGVDPAEAVAALSEAETELRQLSQELEPAGATAEAAAALAENPTAAELGAALQAEQTAAAATAAAELADGLAQLDADARQSLAEALADAAATTGDAAQAETLARAAEALSEGDSDAAADALRDLAEALAQQAQAEAAAAQAQGAAEALGEARQAVAAASAPPGQTAEAGTATGAGETGASNETGGEGETGTSGGQTAESQNGTGGPTPGGGHVENVFVPAPVDLGGQGEELPLETQCLGDACGPAVETPGQARPEGGSFVPFDQVLGQYRDAAFEALPGSDVPLGLQSLVRDYFTALEP